MRGRESQEVWNEHVHTAIFKMYNQQEPKVLCSMLCGSLDGSLVENGYRHTYG